MRVFLAASLLFLPISAVAAGRPHHHTSTHALVGRHSESHVHRTEHTSFFERSTASITPERATEIQTALIQKGYLSGEPTGTWDSASIAAVQKLQSDNGWQTRIVPDSRALIKLGLGPNDNPTPAIPSTATPPSESAASVHP